MIRIVYVFKALVLQGWEDGSASKLVPHRHGDLSLAPWHHCKKLNVKNLICNPCIGEAETESLGFASQAL